MMSASVKDHWSGAGKQLENDSVQSAVKKKYNSHKITAEKATITQGKSEEV